MNRMADGKHGGMRVSWIEDREEGKRRVERYRSITGMIMSWKKEER